METDYISLDELALVKIDEPKVFSIDAAFDVKTKIKYPLLEYLVIHRLPYENEPKGKIFVTAFDGGIAQFDDECFPYYEKLTKKIAKISKGKVSARDHPRNLIIIPSKPITVKGILGWLKGYEKIDDAEGLLVKVRYKQ